MLPMNHEEQEPDRMYKNVEDVISSVRCDENLIISGNMNTGTIFCVDRKFR